MLLRLLRDPPRAPTAAWLAAVVVLQFVGVVAMLYLPSLNADIIDNGVATGDTGLHRPHRRPDARGRRWCRSSARSAAVWFGARTAMGFGRDVRAALFHRVGTFSQREVQHFGPPSLITRGTNDVQQVQMLVLMACTIAISSPIMMVGGVIMALREDVGLGWILAVVVPALFLSVGFVVSRMVPSFRLMQSRIDEVNRVLREQITGIRVVRAFVREPHETERFASANGDLTAVAVRAGRWMATMFPLVMLVVNVASVSVIWFGGHRVDSGQMQVGALTAFLTYLMQILMSVMMATFMLMMVPRSSVCGDRIVEVLDTDSSVVPPAEPVTPDPAKRGWLDLDEVVYSYPGAESPVLSDVSFSARPGQTVAVIGSTGSGKSTLVNLVPRLFDVTAGTVSVGGVDVRRARAGRRSGRRSAWCPQRAWLFSGTDREQPAARQAGRHRRGALGGAGDRPGGATSSRPCPRGWTRRSARAAPTSPAASASASPSPGRVVRRPGIYLFDDSFSALDLATDARLRAALRPVTTDATVLIVAQRVSTIIDADLILVLEDGRSSGAAPTTSCSRAVRPTRRSSPPS